MNATKQATHTPGPWSNRNADHIDGSDGTCVACVNRPDGGDRDVESANARLIAAAPDLLAACKLAEQWIAEGYPQDSETILESLTAALARATA